MLVEQRVLRQRLQWHEVLQDRRRRVLERLRVL
jgi:hypothetical protein